MKIFLDTNVLIDYLNKREPFFAEASQVMDLCVSKQVEGVLSSLSVINAAYIMRKAYPKDSLLLKISWLTEKFEVCPINKESIQRAANSRPSDFEDAVQYFSAVQAKSARLGNFFSKKTPIAPFKACILKYSGYKTTRPCCGHAPAAIHFYC